ncbi:MAG TPA: glycosyltransferase family 2 protein, partial [Oscillatoriaceae cyanobacterium]
MRVSIVVPAYNEAANLPTLYARIRDVFAERPELWQLIVVDDHSADETFAVASRLAAEDGRVRAIRFARNAGSHAAILCGLAEADGDCAVVLAADLQDPPETIPELLARWQSGARIVWAVRAERLGESRRTLAFSRFYYWLMRRVAGVRTMPETGADFFLIDRLVIDALAHFQEVNTSLFALLCWMGYRQ